MKKSLLLIAIALISLGLNAQYWSQQNTNMAGAVTGVDQVSIVDSNIAWINGFDGSGSGVYLRAMARTQDGGSIWTPGDYNGFGVNDTVQVLTAVDFYRAFAIGYGKGLASFWKTTDGGANWSKVPGMFTGNTSFADGVKFWDSNNGFCYGDPLNNEYEIYTTSDGGVTWTLVDGANIPNPLSATDYGYNGFECASIVPGGIGFFLTNKGRVFKTTDYGATWTVTPTAPFTSMPSGKIYASSANYIIIANWVTPNWVWKYTTDGGTSWQTFTPQSGTFYDFAMTYVPGTANMFVASSPYAAAKGVAYSNDGGMNWVDYLDATWLQPSGSNIQCLGVGFYNAGIGWVGNYDQFSIQNTVLRYSNPTVVGTSTYTVEGNDFNIFPNPSNGIVHFVVNGPDKGDINMKIYDMTGGLVFENTLNVSGISATDYDFSDMPKGIYIVKLTSANQQLNKKLIIN